MQLTNNEKYLINKYSYLLRKNDINGFFKALNKGIASSEEINHITKFFVEYCGIDVLNGISYVSSHMFENVNIRSNLVIPEQIKLVAEYGFANTSIKSVASTVPNFVDKIMDHAFDDCSNLRELKFVLDTSKSITVGKLCNLRNELVVYLKFIDDLEEQHDLGYWKRIFSVACNYAPVTIKEWN